MTVNYGLNKVRFPSAVRAGSQVRARVTLLSVKESPEFVDAIFLIHVESQSSPQALLCCGVAGALLSAVSRRFISSRFPRNAMRRAVRYGFFRARSRSARPASVLGRNGSRFAE